MAYPSQSGPRSFETEMRQHRGWIIALGVALTILGILAVGAAVLTTMLSVAVLGWMLIIGGVIQVIHAFSAPRWRGVALSLLEGVLYGVVGAVVLSRPLETAALVTLLFATFLIVSGLFRILSVPTFMRIRNGGWVLASGIISLLLGIGIWAQWPVTGLWVLGAFIGIEMIGWGISLLMLGLARDDTDVEARRRLEAA